MIAFPVLGWFLRAVPFALTARGLDRYVRRIAALPQRRVTLANLGAVGRGLLDFGDVAVADFCITGGISIGPGVQIVITSYEQGITVATGISEQIMDLSGPSSAGAVRPAASRA